MREVTPLNTKRTTVVLVVTRDGKEEMMSGVDSIVLTVQLPMGLSSIPV